MIVGIVKEKSGKYVLCVKNVEFSIKKTSK